MSWTVDRVDTLKRDWADGLSASQIAAELGGVTRNAVIGKVHRLGLPGRVKTPILKRRYPRRRKPKTLVYHPKSKVFVAAPEPELVIDALIPLAQRCSIFELNAHNCHWPVGDPCNADFFFCGGIADNGRPYCSGHCYIALQPPLDRRQVYNPPRWMRV